LLVPAIGMFIELIKNFALFKPQYVSFIVTALLTFNDGITTVEKF
jgi:hypothetical protein